MKCSHRRWLAAVASGTKRRGPAFVFMLALKSALECVMLGECIFEGATWLSFAKSNFCSFNGCCHLAGAWRELGNVRLLTREA